MINPKFAFWFGVWTSVLMLVATGGINFTDALPAAIIPAVTKWCLILSAINNTVLTAMKFPGYASDKAVTAAKAVAALALFVASAILILSADARAADVVPAAKTTAASPLANFASGYPYQTSGLYYGAYTLGGGGSVQGTAVGVNSNSLVTNEIGVGGTIGWAWGVPNKTYFIAVEGMFGWRNFNASNVGFSLNGPASLEQRIKIGTPLNQFLALLPSLGLPTAAPFPTMPNGQTVSNVQAYFMFGFHEDDNSLAYNLSQFRQWTFAPSVGIGMLGQLPNGVAVDAWVETVFPDKSICAGPFKCVNQGQKVEAGLAFFF